MNTTTLRLSALVAAMASLGFLLALTGCQTAPPWTLQFQANTPGSVRLDVVGINYLEKPNWLGKKVDEYWTDGVLRAHADRLTFRLEDRTFKLDNQDMPTVPGSAEGLSGLGTATLTVARTNAVWEVWKRKQAKDLAVIGDFGGVAPGTADLRKQILPLNQKSWEAQQLTLQIQINHGEIKVLTPPSPKAARIAAKTAR